MATFSRISTHAGIGHAVDDDSFHPFPLGLHGIRDELGYRKAERGDGFRCFELRFPFWVAYAEGQTLAAIALVYLTMQFLRPIFLWHEGPN